MSTVFFALTYVVTACSTRTVGGEGLAPGDGRGRGVRGPPLVCMLAVALLALPLTALLTPQTPVPRCMLSMTATTSTGPQSWHGAGKAHWDALRGAGRPKRYLCRRVNDATGAPSLSDADVRSAAAWAHAPWSDDFVDIQGDKVPRPEFQTRVKMVWDDEALFIGQVERSSSAATVPSPTDKGACDAMCTQRVDGGPAGCGHPV